MPFGLKQIARTLYSEIGLTESRSYNSGTLGAGATFDSEIFNLQKLQFLQVDQAGITGTDAHRYAPGHVLYWAAYNETAGTTVTVRLMARTSASGTAFEVQALRTTLTPLQMGVLRVDSLGAVWDVFVRLSNDAAGSTLNVSLAVGVRTR